jgi:prevent-host-death family protein
MTHSQWQIQEAKQRFSDLVRSAQTLGPQFVTKHGAEVVVVVDLQEYRRLAGQAVDFKDYLLQAPCFDELPAELQVERSADLARVVDFADTI